MEDKSQSTVKWKERPHSVAAEETPFCSWGEILCNPMINPLLLLSFSQPASHQVCGDLLCGHQPPATLLSISRLSLAPKPSQMQFSLLGMLPVHSSGQGRLLILATTA